MWLPTCSKRYRNPALLVFFLSQCCKVAFLYVSYQERAKVPVCIGLGSKFTKLSRVAKVALLTRLKKKHGGAFHEQGWNPGEKFVKIRNEKSLDFYLFSVNMMFELIRITIRFS